MMPVKYQLYALAGRIPNHSLVSPRRLPSLCRCLRRREPHEIAYHRTVQPIRHQAPTLVRRHPEYLLLRRKLHRERLLRQLLCRIAPHPDAAIRRLHVHSSVSIVNGHLVILHPVSILAANHEVHELVHKSAAYLLPQNNGTASIFIAEIPRRTLLHNHHRQPRVPHIDIVSPRNPVRAHLDALRGRPIHLRLAALNHRPVRRNCRSVCRAEIRNKLEIK